MLLFGPNTNRYPGLRFGVSQFSKTGIEKRYYIEGTHYYNEDICGFTIFFYLDFGISFLRTPYKLAEFLGQLMLGSQSGYRPEGSKDIPNG